MLVLNRGQDESIEIGGGAQVGGITITVVEIRGDKVRLGITAPKEISVHRKEVADAIAREGRDPARSVAAGDCAEGGSA